MKKQFTAIVADALKLNLGKMVNYYYALTVGAFLFGVITLFSINTLWTEVKLVQSVNAPNLILAQEMQSDLLVVRFEADRLIKAVTEAQRESQLEEIARLNEALTGKLQSLAGALGSNQDIEYIGEVGVAFFDAFLADEIIASDIIIAISDFTDALEDLKETFSAEIETGFQNSQDAHFWSITVVIVLTVGAVISMVLSAMMLAGVIGRPVSDMTDSLVQNTIDIETVFGEISEGAKKQTDVVSEAIVDLEDMIINTIQGNIAVSVEKQGEISKGFADFLHKFVERTAAEIAMGMLSISQQSKEAISAVEKSVAELGIVEGNIQTQATTIDGMVESLKNMVTANREIKNKAYASTKAADDATEKMAAGQERVVTITKHLQEVRTASEGVKDITDSLAKITESIKILALNMSLKVEDIRDDTGKSYGFETMSSRVQELAEEVEGLLNNSNEMLIPTIEGIEKVTIDAEATSELIEDVAKSIKLADSESKAIAVQIDNQTYQIDRLETEAENLKKIADKTTSSIKVQTELSAELRGLLEDSEILIETVNEQTKDASDGARKVNEMMVELKDSLASIESGTGVLTEKSVIISEMFDNIKEQAERNLGGAKKLENVSHAVRDISSQLSVVVKGEELQ